MKKTMVKKTLSCLLAGTLVLGAALLSGCTKTVSQVKTDPENPTVIELWHYYNGPQKTAFDSLVTEFNETVGVEQGIVVEASSQGSISELIKKVLDAANKKVGAEEIPQIFAAYPDTAYQVDKLGLVAGLDSYFTDEELARYVPGYIEEGRFDKAGSLKIFPVAKSTEVLMLNKTDWDKFSQATGATTDSLKTIEGVTEVAKAYYEWTDSLTPTPDDGKAFFGRDALANYFILGAKQLGKEIFSVQNGEVTVNLDESVMRKLWDNYYTPYINGYFTSIGKFRSDDAKTGDLIALVGSTSGAAYFPDKVTVNDTQSYPILVASFEAPCFADGEKYAVQQGAGMVVSKSDEVTEYASCEFLKWFTEKNRNIDFSVGSGYLPVTKEANQAELVMAALDKMEASVVTTNLKSSLPVAIGMVSNHEMYTTKAFENGTACRAVLESSLAQKAEADLAAMKEKTNGGMSKQEAISQFDTDDNFAAWLASLRAALDKAVKRE